MGGHVREAADGRAVLTNLNSDGNFVTDPVGTLHTLLPSLPMVSGDLLRWTSGSISRSNDGP